MKKSTILFLIFLLMFILWFCECSYPQTYIDISNNTYINITNGTTLYLNSSTANTITKSGTTGGIITQTENDKILWDIGTSTGVFSIPFCSSVGNTIPFTYTISTAGTGTGQISFSCYETNDANIPLPSGVTGINNAAGINNSNKVIDRFWVITPTSYTVKPKGTYVFTYDDNDLVGNTITESNLYSQRWNSNLNKWGDWLYSPTTNLVSNTVTILVANVLDQFPIWTLVDDGSPLPIELLSINAIDNGVPNKIFWTTVSETNTFQHWVQKSKNGYDFTDYDFIGAAGNSNSLLNYELFDYEPYQETYYRLKTLDYDYSYSLSDIVYVAKPTLNEGFKIYDNEIYTFIDFISLEIYDEAGKNLLKYTNINSNSTLKPLLSAGYYIVRGVGKNGYSYSKFWLTK